MSKRRTLHNRDRSPNPKVVIDAEETDSMEDGSGQEATDVVGLVLAVAASVGVGLVVGTVLRAAVADPDVQDMAKGMMNMVMGTINPKTSNKQETAHPEPSDDIDESKESENEIR